MIVLFVREPPRPEGLAPVRSPLSRAQIARLGSAFWIVVVLASAFTLARFSEAFLLLRATNVGLAAGRAPLVLIVMNIVYSASAYWFGHLSDRVNRGSLLAAGIGFLIAADLILAAANSTSLVLIGSMLWGLHMGATQGLLAAIVAAAAPANLRATAFGLFNLVTGGALLLASSLAGYFWTAYGPVVTFLAGAAFSTVALIGLVARLEVERSRPAD